MDKNSRVVIIGAGVFGLSAANQLALEGYHNILVLDKHTPPVRNLPYFTCTLKLTRNRFRMDLALIYPASFVSTMLMKYI